MYELFQFFRGGFPGMPSFGQETRDTLHASGIVSINGTQVRDQATVSGTLKCTEADFNKLEVTGTSTLNSTVVRSTARFVGVVNSRNSNFHGNTEVTSSEAYFQNSTLQNLLIKQQNPSVDQTIILDGSTVNGSVTFESGNGRVILKNDANITGHVNGAQVIRQNTVENSRF